MKIENAGTVGGTRGKQSEKLTQLSKRQENPRGKAVGGLTEGSRRKKERNRNKSAVEHNNVEKKRSVCVNVERRRVEI